MDASETERALAGALICAPERVCDRAFAWLSERDFTDHRCRFVFAAVLAAWDQADGEVTPGPHWSAILATGLAHRCHMSEEEAGYWIEDTLDLAPGATHPALFEWHARKLHALRTLRATRKTLTACGQRIAIPGTLAGLESSASNEIALLEAALGDLRRVGQSPGTKAEEKVQVSGDWM